MSEEEIRLNQTIKVFDMLALLVKNNETCTYRYLIYDMLGFKEENYVDLLNGMEITNALVDLKNKKEELEYINHCNEELRKKITNLEYKIERLEEENERLNMVVTIQEDYKSRNEKAIEYINNCPEYLWANVNTKTLLNLLQGVDKE